MSALYPGAPARAFSTTELSDQSDTVSAGQCDFRAVTSNTLYFNVEIGLSGALPFISGSYSESSSSNAITVRGGLSTGIENLCELTQVQNINVNSGTLLYEDAQRLTASFTGTENDGRRYRWETEISAVDSDAPPTTVSASKTEIPIPPDFDMTLSPDMIAAYGTSTVTFTIDNTAYPTAATNLDFSNYLPASVIVVSATNGSTTCTGGTLTAIAGTGTITYSGGSVGAGESCTVSVDVTGVMGGEFTNTTGDLTSSAGNSGSASATLTVDEEAPSVAIDGAPETITDLAPFEVTVNFSEPVYGFTQADVTVGNGTVTGFFGTDGDETYTVEITPATQGEVTIDVAAGVAEDEVGNANTAAAQVVIEFGSQADTVALIGAMLELRSKLILEHGPDAGRRIDRLNGTYSNTGGVGGFGLAYRNDALPFAVMLGRDSASFAYSLRNARAAGGQQGLSGSVGSVATNLFGAPADYREPAETATLAYSGPPAKDAADAADAADGVSPLALLGKDEDDIAPANQAAQRYDIWAEGSFSRFDATAGDGEFAILHAGADYLVTPDVLVGLGTQFDWIDMDAATGAGTADGWGFMAGPYATAKLADGFYLDARGAWGRAWNAVSPYGSYEDDYGSERWLATAALIGDFEAEGFDISPEARLSWYRETSEAYLDSLSNPIPSVTVKTGTFAFGPTIRRSIALQDGVTVTPFTTLTGIWTFAQDNTATAFTGQPGLSGEGLRGRVEAGLDLANDTGLSLSVSGHYDGIGEDGYVTYGGRARLGQTF